jgi:hypothetical protein
VPSNDASIIAFACMLSKAGQESCNLASSSPMSSGSKSRRVDSVYIVAHQVGRIATKFKSSDNPLAAIKDKITHFLIAPKRFH